MSKPASATSIAYDRPTPMKGCFVMTVHPFDQMLAEGAPQRIGSATER
jgi:hypothetical protein